LISGAGIAGLAASFELIAKDFNVVITEKRNAFDRFNLINLDIESQRFLKRFGLLSAFEEKVAGRILVHKYLHIEGKNIEELKPSDVSKLQSSRTPFEPEFYKTLFKEDAVYSVKIKNLQTFLAEKALDAGVRIFGNTETEDISPTLPAPDLLLIAEGTHSTAANQLGMQTKEVKNACTGENWIFGSVPYSGTNTFVVCVIDTSEGSLEIANVIFNANVQEINIAVTSKKHLSQELIEKKLLKVVKDVISFLQIDESPQSLIASVKRPVNIKNEKRVIYSHGIGFTIGDAAGHSSPLAGMGGTLGLTLVLRTIEQLILDLELRPDKMHEIFHRFTEAYVSRWIDKSESVKKYC